MWFISKLIPIEANGEVEFDINQWANPTDGSARRFVMDYAILPWDSERIRLVFAVEEMDVLLQPLELRGGAELGRRTVGQQGPTRCLAGDRPKKLLAGVRDPSAVLVRRG